MEHQKYWECFQIKTGCWVELKVKTVLSKTDATSSVERCSSSDRPRMARSPDMISDMAAEQSDLNPIDYVVWGDTTRVYVQLPPDHGRGRAAPACQGWMGPSGPGSDWQRHQWMAHATDSLRCSRQRTFWTFILNITAFVHILINMFWTLLTLLSFV